MLVTDLKDFVGQCVTYIFQGKEGFGAGEGEKSEESFLTRLGTTDSRGGLMMVDFLEMTRVVGNGGTKEDFTTLIKKH